MSQILTRIANIIVDVARNEDLLLRRVGRGIFVVPELAFVYTVGRTIASRAHEIFGTTDVRWLPESAIGDVGRVDLKFEVKDQPTYAFEFKRSGTGAAYVQDLKKLASLDDGKYERIFCALIDAWPDDIDPNPRIKAVEESGIPLERLIEHFDFFATLDSRYVNQVCCVVGLWHVAPISVSSVA